MHMLVHQDDLLMYQEELVPGELSQHITDLIAHIKMGGGTGIRSELNFCLYCHCHLSSLLAAAGSVGKGTQLEIILINPT